MKTPPLLLQDIYRPADFNSEFFTALVSQRDMSAKGIRPTAIHLDDSSGTVPPAVPSDATASEGAVRPLTSAPASQAFDSEFFVHLAEQTATNAWATKPHRVDPDVDLNSEAINLPRCSDIPLVNPWMAMQAAMSLTMRKNVGLFVPMDAGWHAQADLLMAALVVGNSRHAMQRPEKTGF